MNRHDFKPVPLIGTVILAVLFWFVTFYLSWTSFWIKISLSAATLAILSLLLQPKSRERIRIDIRAIALGLVSATILYIIFWAGKTISGAIFPFSAGQISGIYDKGAGTPMWVIALLLFFVGAAILTPPDVVTQVMMAMPLMLLYEISIIGARIFARKPIDTENDTEEKTA